MKIQHTSRSQMDVRGYGSTDENGVLEVPDKVAGHPPEQRLLEAMRELHEAIARFDHAGAVKLRDEITGLDHGSGFLAQDVWVPVSAPKHDVPAAPKAGGKEADK